MNNPADLKIQAENLVHEYKSGRGVSGVSFSVHAGECYAVLGRNGSGKSTLARLLIGLTKPSSGALTILGQKLGSYSSSHRSHLGVVLDTSHHWESLSGYENAWFVARSYGVPLKAIADRLGKLFERADLSSRAQDPVKSYSFGMRRKLSFIQALSHEPQVLILDEPTTGIDAHFLLALAEIIKKRSDKGRATWVAGNDPGWIAGVASRVAFMDDGHFLAEGTVPDLVREVSPFQEVQVVLTRPIELPAPAIDGLRSFKQQGDTIYAFLERKPELIPMVMEKIIALGGEIRSLEVKQGTLRDAFLLKTGKTLGD